MRTIHALHAALVVLLSVAASVAAEPAAGDLGSSEPDARLAAALAAAEDPAQAKQAVPQLAVLLEDPVVAVRHAAAQALETAGADAQSATAALIEALDDDAALDENVLWTERQTVRMAAMRALAAVGPPAIPSLLQALDDRRPAVARGAMGAIYYMGSAAREAVPALVRRLKQDHDADRLMLVQALSGIGPAAGEAVPVLTEYLAHDDFHTRYWSAQALGAIGPGAKPAVPALIQRIEEDVVSVRRHSAAALGKIGPGIGREGLQALAAALDDPLEPVREDAAEALGRLGEFAQPAADKLQAVVEKRKIAARTVAARSVWKITGDAEWPRKVLLDELAEITWADRAREVLMEMGQADAARERLVEQLASPRKMERLAAAETLGRMGPAAEAALPALEQATRDADADVARAAADALTAVRAGEVMPQP